MNTELQYMLNDLFFYLEDSIWVLVLILLGASFAIKIYFEKKRSEALALTARDLGFSFSKEGRKSTSEHCRYFNLFSKGRVREIKNEMWGKAKFNAISIFGYSFIVGSGKHSVTHDQTVLTIQCSELASPKFFLKPEGTFDKIAQAFGAQDINFNSSPIFSDNYQLSGDDEDEIRAFFTPEVIQFFEVNQGLFVEGIGETFVFYKPRKRCKPQELNKFIEEGQSVFSVLARKGQGW